MNRILMMTVAAVFVATAAAAAISPESVVDTFKADGYGSIEVKVGPTQIKAEAVKGGVKVEIVYDKETGAILKQETEAAGATISEVEIKFEDSDFVNGDDSDDSPESEDESEDANDDNSGHGSGGNSGSGGGNSGSAGGGSGSGGGSSGSGG